MQTLLFTNYTKESFTHKWDNVESTFKGGQSMAFVEGEAFHFAKHLAMRELNKRDVITSQANIKEEMKKALGGTGLPESPNEAKTNAEVLNYNVMNKKELLKTAEDKGVKIDGRKSEENIIKDLQEFEGAKE